jgi:inorganic phosphate transporter, PiT family
VEVAVDTLLISAVGIVALALLFDFSNGFHDAANSVATVVATRAMSARTAVAFSALCNFAAFFFVGTAVANTVAKTVKTADEGVAVVFAALFAAIVWNYLTWFFGMPSSSSHAIIGGLVGAGIASGGTDAINWKSVQKTVSAIVVSPLVAALVAVIGTGVVLLLQFVTRWGNDARPFKGLQLFSAAAVSFGHGANDAQKTMGVIAALLTSAGYISGSHSGGIVVPDWVALAAYSAIAAGTMWGGWRIIETMGLKLTPLDARTGVAANIGATTAIFGATALGVPISTTHAAASSVVGAGIASRRGVDWSVVGRMATAWVVTIPASASVGWLVLQTTRLPSVLAPIAVITLVTLMLLSIGWAMRHTIGARHVEEAARREAGAAGAAGTVPAEAMPVHIDLTRVNGATTEERPASVA